MNCLLYAVLIIVVYAEVLPTISLMFDYIRAWIAYGIVLVQTKAEEVQSEEEKNVSTHAIGFDYMNEPEFDDGDEEDE